MNRMKHTAKLVCLVLALIFVVALFAGCGGGQQQPQTQETQKPAEATPAPTPMTAEIVQSGGHEITEETKYADDITMGYAAVGATLSPLNVSSSGAVSQIVYLMMYNTLLSRDREDLEGFIPELATEWSHDDDCIDWTFKLRDDVYFTNGEKLTAEDVRFTWEQFMSHPGTTGNIALNSVADVEVVNDYEVIYHLVATDVDFEDTAANHGAMILSKKAIEELGDEEGALIGSGVWKLKEFKSDTYIIMEANPDTWEPPALAKTFTFKAVSEQTSKAIMFENGELDFISDVPAQYQAQYDADPNLELDRWSNISTNYIAFNMNTQWGGNIDFRRACAYAIDREAIMEIATQGTGHTWDSAAYWGNGTAYKRNDLPILEQDFAKAKEYLEKAGYKGEEVTILTGSSGVHADVAQVVQQQLAEAGINATIFGTDVATMMANSAWGSVSYDIMTFGGPWQSIPSSCYFTLQTGLIGNKAQYSNARVDELIIKGAATPNGPERQAIYEEIQDIVADEIPYIGTMNQNVSYGRHANCGGGVYWPEGVIDYTYAYKILEE